MGGSNREIKLGGRGGDGDKLILPDPLRRRNRSRFVITDSSNYRSSPPVSRHITAWPETERSEDIGARARPSPALPFVEYGRAPQSFMPVGISILVRMQ